ncbi:MAG TPA: hypothetical protein VNX29_07165 [Kaistia sp.]|nr:hypothetical protein [Kaistia sp.]
MSPKTNRAPGGCRRRGSEIDFERHHTSGIKPARSRQAAQEVRVGGCVIGQFGVPPKAPRQISRVEIRLGRRRNELRKLAEDRIARRIPLTDPLGLALVLADIAAHSAAGLDERTFADAAIRARVIIPADVAEQAVDRVQRAIVRKGGKYRPISDATAGEAVRLLRDERIRLDIRTLAAVDESPEERRAFVREGRQHRDRETKRIVRGCKPRSVFEAESLAKSQPWIAQGVSRATWFRRRQHRETGVSADSLSSLDERRHTCLTECPSGEIQSAGAALRAPSSPPELRSSGDGSFIDVAPARRPLNVAPLSLEKAREPGQTPSVQSLFLHLCKSSAPPQAVTLSLDETENRKDHEMSKTDTPAPAPAASTRARIAEAAALLRAGRPIAAEAVLRPLLLTPAQPLLARPLDSARAA